MPQIHLHAEPGDYAPLVLLPGDPNRATLVASMFDGGLAKARLVNAHRQLLGYTRTYNAGPVSVQTSGIGTPSLSIVPAALPRLGVRRRICIELRAELGLPDERRKPVSPAEMELVWDLHGGIFYYCVRKYIYRSRVHEDVQTLIEHDLVDEYRLLTFPVTLGGGKRLFGAGTLPRSLRLVRTGTTGTGVVIGVYRPAGALKTGSFARE